MDIRGTPIARGMIIIIAAIKQDMTAIITTGDGARYKTGGLCLPFLILVSCFGERSRLQLARAAGADDDLCHVARACASGGFIKSRSNKRTDGASPAQAAFRLGGFRFDFRGGSGRRRSRSRCGGCSSWGRCRGLGLSGFCILLSVGDTCQRQGERGGAECLG